MNNQIIIIGAFQEMTELCLDCGFDIVGYIDSQRVIKSEGRFLGGDDDLVSIYNQYGDIPVVITPDNPQVRKKLYYKYKETGFKFQTIVSPTAHISPSATIDVGSVVQHGANVSSNVRIGSCVKINVNANVMHDCVIDDFTTIAPNAVLLGKVHIAKACYIGANSTILPYHQIGSGSVVGAGAVVTKDVEDNNVVMGIPARPSV